MTRYPRKLVIRTLAAAAVLAVIASGQAAAQQIKGPATAAVNQEIRLVVDGLDTPELGKATEWAAKLKLATSSPQNATVFADPELTLGLGTGGLKLKLYFQADKPGVYVIVLDDNNSNQLLLHRITVGGEVPPEPAPGPGPKPPEPTPPPTPPLSGFSLMIIEETAARSTLPRSQVSAIASATVRQYLAAKNATWRIWDDDYTAEQMSGEAKQIQELYKRAVFESGGNVPWIVVGNEKGSESRALPQDEASFLALLKKWGG